MSHAEVKKLLQAPPASAAPKQAPIQLKHIRPGLLLYLAFFIVWQQSIVFRSNALAKLGTAVVNAKKSQQVSVPAERSKAALLFRATSAAASPALQADASVLRIGSSRTHIPSSKAIANAQM